MKVFILITFALISNWASAQNSNYRKLIKGQPSPYDTAVAVQIKTYRLESQKLEKADSIIQAQQSLIQEKEYIIRRQETVLQNSDRISAQKTVLLNESEAVVEQSFKRIDKLLQYKKPFYDRPLVWSILGGTVVYLITR